jgi:hypothetical protein
MVSRNKIYLPVNNLLIDYRLKRYDKIFSVASDVIDEKFTASVFLFGKVGDRWGWGCSVGAEYYSALDIACTLRLHNLL